MNLDPKLYATRGYYPSKRTSFSVATRGFSIELGIKMSSYIMNFFVAESEVKTPIVLTSKIL